MNAVCGHEHAVRGVLHRCALPPRHQEPLHAAEIDAEVAGSIADACGTAEPDVLVWDDNGDDCEGVYGTPDDWTKEPRS